MERVLLGIGLNDRIRNSDIWENTEFEGIVSRIEKEKKNTNKT